MINIYRTDLASEAHFLLKKARASNSAIEGVNVINEELEGVKLCFVEVLNQHGVEAIGKDIGKYFTLELEKHFERGSEFFPFACLALSKIIRRCFAGKAYKSFIIAALGNPDITPDALGSLCASSILVTRHLKQSCPEDFSVFNETSLCRTGVLGTTGIESASQIRLLCDSIKPDCLIVIDALAGADVSRLCSTIQVSTAGIAPGSGVGNNREEISSATLGIPVIAIGMPTVIDAGNISLESEYSSMFVTPRGIDSMVRSAAKLIAYGINLALHPGISISDIDMLVG